MKTYKMRENALKKTYKKRKMYRNETEQLEWGKEKKKNRECKECILVRVFQMAMQQGELIIVNWIKGENSKDKFVEGVL